MEIKFSNLIDYLYHLGGQLNKTGEIIKSFDKDIKILLDLELNQKIKKYLLDNLIIKYYQRK